jgi:hypothetical protein
MRTGWLQHPRLDHESFLHPDSSGVEPRHAQLAASLSRALQSCRSDHAAVFVERIARESDHDLPF